MRAGPSRIITVTTYLLLASCGGNDGPALAPPDAPGENDPAFEVTELRSWYLVGNDATPGHDQLDIAVTPPDDVSYIDVWIDGAAGVRLTEVDGTHRFSMDIGALAIGEHEVILGADGDRAGFARFTFRRSHPLYVLVTTDWDFSDPGNLALDRQDLLHEEHPSMLLTHFVGPYTFTDPAMTPERIAEIITWLESVRDSYGDEIGLHIHPYCNFVDTVAGVDCVTDQSTVYAEGDPSGYTIMCSAYTEEEFTSLLIAADAIFEANGLGKPTSFRAGGWTADLSTLRSLEAAGYVTDTSANNWQRMEEWEGVLNGVLFEWNMTHWATIGDTSQPYYPNVDDILSDAQPTIGLLELPDNGIMVDYVSTEEMIEIFEANWSGDALSAPTAFSIGFHPSTSFTPDEYYRVHDTLTHVEQFLAADDAGPVVYGLQSDMVRVWPRPE